MGHRAHRVCLLIVLASCLAADVAEAWPRRRHSTTTTYASSGSVRVAPKLGDSANYRPLAAYYDYESASSDEVAFIDRLRVFVDVRDPAVLACKEPLVAEVEITDLSDHESSCVRFLPATMTCGTESVSGRAVFDLENGSEPVPLVKPARVYRLFVSLHRQGAAYGESTALGRIPTPYYVATSGVTRLERARQQIVMRSFREFYYTEKGWPRYAQYPMDCHAFYLWATGSCTVGAQQGRTMLGRLFGRLVPYRSSGHLPALARVDCLHGDYVRIPGHTFMVLAYDRKLSRLWTLEANFNHTIEVAQRSLGSGWSVGHLDESHIREELFPPTFVSPPDTWFTAAVSPHGLGL